MSSDNKLRKNSLRNHFSQVPKEKASRSNGKSGSRSEHKIDTSESAQQLTNTNPWNGKKAATVDEVMNRKSTVPSFLRQQPQRGASGSLQHKALNIGVLEWNLLEKWSRHQSNQTTSPSRRASTSSVTSSSVEAAARQSCARKDELMASNYCHGTVPLQDSQTELICDFRSSSFRQSNRLFASRTEIVLDFTRTEKGHNSSIPKVSRQVTPKILHLSEDQPHTPAFHCEIGYLPPVKSNSAVHYETEVQADNYDHLTSSKDDLERDSATNWHVASACQRYSDAVTEPNTEANWIDGSRSWRDSSNKPDLNDAAATRPGRPSPFRRMLDPLLKRKTSCQSFDSQHNMTLARTRQALLQVTWKNGLPLLVFTSGDDARILAATAGRRGMSSDTSILQGLYTIFAVNDCKRKGMLIKKQQQLTPDVIADISMSCHAMSVSHGSKLKDQDLQLVREFVVVGSELRPTEPQAVKELASVVFSIPAVRRDSNDEHPRPPRIVAILPGGSHGSSADGIPSSLIKRWESGGTCDCGGWDEGCKLTVLTDRDDDTISGTCQRIELFFQGRPPGDGPSFTAFRIRDGLHVVEFRSSVITPFQAFAICIPLFHCNSLDAEPRDCRCIAGGGDSRYVPSHPPLSPVGRV